jgi:hypothetical protein
MDIWDYDRKTGALLGPGRATPNPEEPGNLVLPAYATTIRPPSVPEGCVAIFNGGLSAVGEWRIELAENQFGEICQKECAALSTMIKAYVDGREDHDGARNDIARVVEELIDRADMSVRDEARFMFRTLIYGKSVN